MVRETRFMRLRTKILITGLLGLTWIKVIILTSTR
jgi:hypothetical protein